MLARRVAQLAIVWLALFTQSAYAFFDPPWITPESPRAGETVYVNIYGGDCDWIAGREGYPQITQDGFAIRILEYGHHYEPGDELCIGKTGTVVDPIGAFAPGTYVLTVDMVYQHPVFGPTILHIGVVTFTVSAREQSTPVPVIGVLGVLALSALLLVAAARRLRAHLTILLVLLPIGFPTGTHAQTTQTIEFTLSQSFGAPTPTQVVAWMQSSPRSASS